MKILVDAVIYLLNLIYSFVGNYGIAIIITTIFVRILMLPLTLKQEKSMKRMRELEPKMKVLKEKYKNEPNTLNQKTMELYKEEGVNPFGGCLPLLIQFPIFIALYNAFRSSAMPHDAYFLWFNLSQPDRLFTLANYSVNALPILTAILTIYQQKMMQTSSSSEDTTASAMKSMMYTMPIMLLVVFYKMPSGLNLYYLTNTILSILQQYYVLSRRD